MKPTITYRGLQDRDVSQVRQILHYVFFSPQGGDPISQRLKYEVPRETERCVEAIILGARLDGVSVVAVKEESGEIVGLSLCNHITPENSRQIVLPSDNKDTRKMWVTLDILGQAQGDVDVFEMFKVSNYVSILILAVKPGNRCLGIGRGLVENSLEFIKAKGATVAVSTSTSLHSKYIFDHLGFETISELRYHDYMMDGERLCTESGINGHTLCCFCAKRL